MTFTIQNLVGNRTVVSGTDINGVTNSAVVDGTQWAELNRRTDFDRAQADFDAAVEEFFAPLTEAAEKANKAVEIPTDSLAYVVLDEGSDGETARPRNVVKLSKDSMVLRAIEDGESDRLVWVGDSLEILETLPGTHTRGGKAPSAADVTDAGAEAVSDS